MAHIVGNVSTSFKRGSKSFAGINGYKSIMPGTLNSVVAKAGETVYLSMQSAMRSLEVAVCVQAVANPVKMSLTLQDINLACNPDEAVQKSVSWCNEQVITPGTIVSLDVPCFSAMKLVFDADASFYVYIK
jgi:hypothetical protein|nr:MAG TPA_asm: hypothetical protein [Caudoviricetes sp.]